MKCPKCLSVSTNVLETRSVPNSIYVRRRRNCKKCKHRWTTIEKPLEETNETPTPQ